jgi:hypothetical protein
MERDTGDAEGKTGWLAACYRFFTPELEEV